MKPGVQTSEFILAVVTLVCLTVLVALDKIDGTVFGTLLTTVTGAYSLSRGVAKINPPKAPDASGPVD